MRVEIKNFKVQMEIKNTGIELDVRDNSGNHLGDLYVSKANLVWCKGKTTRKNGKLLSWEEFMTYMDSQ